MAPKRGHPFCEVTEPRTRTDRFIAHPDVAARGLLLPYGDVVIALSTVLRIKRTLDGAEIDALISDVQARKALAIERTRRKARP